jgi:hypothetical protein
VWDQLNIKDVFAYDDPEFEGGLLQVARKINAAKPAVTLVATSTATRRSAQRARAYTIKVQLCGTRSPGPTRVKSGTRRRSMGAILAGSGTAFTADMCNQRDNLGFTVIPGQSTHFLSLGGMGVHN